MREILFRGKTKDGVWYHGFIKGKSLPNYEGNKMEFTPCIIEQPYADIWVIPETVGQYTGLTDKNDKKIFEGDIVVVYARGYHTVCTVSWADVVAQFQLWQINTVPKTSTNLNLGNYDCEVIGNIHDNPELLKGGEG